VAQVVKLAGFSPLAISLLARVYARHPSWTLADLATETRDSLLTFKSENDTIAAALAGISPDRAAGLLDGLHGEGLLTETGHRRYGMRDLLRRYAHDHAAGPGTDRDQALGRLLDYHQYTAALARDRLAHQTRPGPSPSASPAPAAVPALEDTGQALAWARAERDSLLACL